MEKGKKVTRQYRIAEPIDRELNEISNATGKTKTAIIEEALLQYFKSSKQNEYEKIADTILGKFDEKYSAYQTRIRLRVCYCCSSVCVSAISSCERPAIVKRCCIFSCSAASVSFACADTSSDTAEIVCTESAIS